jgi:peptidoglycan/xylan/chitin deacetylase (PgdA/CDA1 family)
MLTGGSITATSPNTKSAGTSVAPSRASSRAQASGDSFYGLLTGAFDVLWREGAQQPKMMSVGLHGRISGHPARAGALARFLDYVQAHDSVWVCRRDAIARHWLAEHPTAV